MRILYVSCSPRGEASESHRLAQKIVGFLLKSEPTATLINRVIGSGALPPIDEAYAISQQASEDVSKAGTAAVSDELIKELQSADAVVSRHSRAQLHRAFRAEAVDRSRRAGPPDFRCEPGRARSACCATAPSLSPCPRAESSPAKRSRQPDFRTPYLKAILGMIGLRNLTFFTVQGRPSVPRRWPRPGPRQIKRYESILSGRESQQASRRWTRQRRLLIPPDLRSVSGRHCQRFAEARRSNSFGTRAD